METTLRQVISGNFCTHHKQIKTNDGKVYDFRNSWLTPQTHHVIVTTSDGFKLALNPYNGICYKILGEKYN